MLFLFLLYPVTKCTQVVVELQTVCLPYRDELRSLSSNRWTVLVSGQGQGRKRSRSRFGVPPL